MSTEIGPPTVRVEIMNDTLVDPAATKTLAGTMTGSKLDNDTNKPPAGAAAVSVIMPVTELPPSTLEALSETVASLGRAVTVSAVDRLLPLRVAVMVVVPAVSAVTVNVAVDDPESAITAAATLATAGLELDKAMLVPPAAAAAVRVMEP
jgi:hypothetical protein